MWTWTPVWVVKTGENEVTCSRFRYGWNYWLISRFGYEWNYSLCSRFGVLLDFDMDIIHNVYYQNSVKRKSLIHVLYMNEIIYWFHDLEFYWMSIINTTHNVANGVKNNSCFRYDGIYVFGGHYHLVTYHRIIFIPIRINYWLTPDRVQQKAHPTKWKIQCLHVLMLQIWIHCFVGCPFLPDFWFIQSRTCLTSNSRM